MHKEQQDERIRELIAQDIESSDDGFYYWFPNKTTGYLSAHVLRVIADILDAKNESWEKQIVEYFDANPQDCVETFVFGDFVDE